MAIRHTILMITYNQQDYIAESLSCLFRQGILPYEIIISDDASTDLTVEIIHKFQKKYPGMIHLHAQEKNIGINSNLNYLLKNASINGDIINFLSGDDLYEDGMLEEFNNFISIENINPNEEKFLIISNQLSMNLNGIKKLEINNFKLRNKNYTKLKLRNLIGNRYTGISKALFNSIGEWNESLGLWADALHSFDLYCTCDNFYFINKPFPVYRKGSGITSKVKSDILINSYIKVANYILQHRDTKLDILDRLYLRKSILHHSSSGIQPQSSCSSCCF